MHLIFIRDRTIRSWLFLIPILCPQKLLLLPANPGVGAVCRLPMIAHLVCEHLQGFVLVLPCLLVYVPVRFLLLVTPSCHGNLRCVVRTMSLLTLTRSSATWVLASEFLLPRVLKLFVLKAHWILVVSVWSKKSNWSPLLDCSSAYSVVSQAILTTRFGF